MVCHCVALLFVVLVTCWLLLPAYAVADAFVVDGCPDGCCYMYQFVFAAAATLAVKIVVNAVLIVVVVAANVVVGVIIIAFCLLVFYC